MIKINIFYKTCIFTNTIHALSRSKTKQSFDQITNEIYNLSKLHKTIKFFTIIKYNRFVISDRITMQIWRIVTIKIVKVWVGRLCLTFTENVN